MMKDLLQPYVDRQAVAGAVTLVANGAGVLSVDAVGYADIAAGRPMAPDALFWIASMTKPITAAALMMLVDEGRVSIDDPVERFLPEFADMWVLGESDDARRVLVRPVHPVTVRNIMAHTSGLPFMSAVEHPTLDRLPLDIAARSYAATTLQTQPDTRYEYSNAGINTAGRIIEVVSGEDYETFLNTRLFGPLGMVDTSFRPNAAQLTRLATAYKPTADNAGLEATTIAQLAYPLDSPARQPMPAGGLFSTAVDVARFCRMVLNDGCADGRRYLTTTAISQMTSKQTGDLEAAYGLGWGLGDGTYGHGGALATNMTIDPGRDLITVYLVQHAGFPLDGAAAQGAFEAAAQERFGK